MRFDYKNKMLSIVSDNSKSMTDVNSDGIDQREGRVNLNLLK